MKRVLVYLGIIVAVVNLSVGLVAAQSSSSNFQIEESFVGPGGSLESNSTNYGTAPGQQAVNGVGGGPSASTNFRADSGPISTDDPSLSCTVDTASVNFGALSTSVAATATATFSVLNYTSYGYIVQIVGSPPSTGSYTLAGMTSTGPSAPGTEQFGINLVANTSPTTFGANPVQTPDSSFSSGAAASNYNTANNFRYVAGETIASAAASSGLTEYTMSYIINAANTTAGGTYSGEQTLVCVGTY
ncbi:hypothetical protein KA047_01990 [Candidatus Saccharibacteria bacterium]|nr:hypothetical protein [Candidatus Saccharibacteria bacterium]